jgi:single-stranded DNA-binding protein
MTAFVLITGTLFRAAEQKTSQAGKRYVTATMKAASVDASNSEFWSVLAFSDTAQTELLRLGAGEKLSIQGSLKLTTFEANGETRISRTVFADAVLPLRAAPKEKKPKATVTTPAGRPPLERVNILPDRSSDLDDDIPF